MRQIIILIALLVILAATAELGARVEVGAPFDTLTLTATGFILLAAYVFGELFRRVRLPALLGYLAAGMLFGPNFSELVFGNMGRAPIDPVALDHLQLVNMLAVGVIGTMGGGEIRIADLRESFGKIAAITGIVFALVLPLVTALVISLSLFAPSLVPFLSDLAFEAQLAAALLFAVLAAGMSPSATLALLLEVRAQGRFTSLVLGVVVLADLLLVATFLLVLALAKLLVSPEGVSATRLLEVLPHIGAEFGWAILLGIIVGVVFIAYLRLVGRELLLFSLGIIFVTSFVASRLHAETLLAFLVGGFVVQNFSRHGHTLIEAFEQIALPVFVIYFTTQAANLDLISVTVYLPLTLILVATRLSLFYFGIGGAARLAKIDDNERRLLRFSFFSQGGVDLVLAALIAQAIPTWGPEVQTVTMATILIYVVVGPPLLARALDQAGESAAARERGAETLETRKPHHVSSSKIPEFPILETANKVLDSRLLALREQMTGVLDNVVSQTIAKRCEQRRALIASLAQTITSAVDPADVLDDRGLFDSERIRAALDGMHIAVKKAAVEWNNPSFRPVERATLQSTFDRLTNAERFATVYRIIREPSLFDPAGSRLHRVIRFFRRVRRSVLGPGLRTVPIGRLWRYHVALDVPVAAWSTVQAEESKAWARLVHHYRSVSEALEAFLAGRRPPLEPPLGRSLSGAQAATSQVGEASSSDVSAAPAQLVGEVRQAAMERERELVTTLEQHDAELEQGLGGALAEAWAAFLASLAVAGTLEHPSWRYRVSTRYDAAQAATADLRERLERDAKAAGGLRDSAAAIAHASHLRRSARRATAQWVNALATDLDSVAPEIDRALTSCSRLTEAAIAEGEDVGAQLATTLERTASTLELVARRLERPDLLRQRRSNLTRPLAAVPEQLSPSLHRAAFAKSERDERRFPIRLRAWLGQTLVRDVTVALLDSEAETARRLTANAVSLHHARQVLDYHLLTPHGAGESVDAGIGERLSALIEAASRDLGDVVRVAEEALIARTEQAVAASIPPVLEGRWEELQRRLRRLDEGAVSKAAVAQWVRAGGRRAVSRVRHGLRHLADEVTAVFIESSTPAAVALYHKLLFGPRSSMNEAYQRLFTSVPAESVGLVIDRPEAATLEDGIERWLEGVGGPVLVRGDRGVGKRTLVRSVVGHLGDRIEPRWLSLSPSLDREDDVAPALSELLGWRPASSFVTLERTYKALRRLGRAPSKMAIVVENTERLFRRTPEGLRCMGEFLDFVETTHREVLWIVLVTEPAVRRIDPVLELKGRFAVQLQVRPMTSAELERVLTSRHRLSGYALRFHHHAPSLHEWIRSPGAAWRTKRGTGQAMYERIRLLSAGNVRQALRLWLAAAHLDEGEEGKVVVGPIDAIPATLTDDLPLLSKIILAALLLHGSLRRTELTDIGLRSGRDLDAEITRLVHLGLVEVEVEPASSMAKPRRDPLVEVRTRLVAPLTEELRACNLL